MKNLTLTLDEALTIHAAISILSKERTTVVTKDGEETVVQVPYKLSASARYALAANLATLSTIAQAAEQANNDLIREVSGGGDEITRGTKEFDRYVQEVAALRQRQEPVSLREVHLSGLYLEDNPIPLNVLAALDKVIVDDLGV